MTQDLLEKPQAGQPSVALHAFKGAILALQGDVLQGWAMDTAQPEERPVVEVFIDGASVALTRADQYEPQAPSGDQFHGFAVQLRQSWLADARVITARIANQAFALDGAIVLPVAPSLEASTTTSQVWHTGGLRVGGWSWDPQSPRRHVEVTVREGNRVICTATCNAHNQALAYRDTSDHGFAIDLPWELADGKVHVLEFVNDLGQPLAGSPIRLCCWPEGVEGLLRNLDPAHDTATVALLTEVAKEQALLLPRSAGWQDYPQWFEAFQHLEGTERPPMQGKVGLLLITNGDPALEQRSLNSLGDDRANLHQLATAATEDLLPALQQLLAAGCDRILPLMAGDRLAPLALLHLCTLLDEGGAWAFADCDCDGPQSERSMPWLKPVWDIDLFIGADIFTPGAIFGASIVVQALALLEATTKQPSINWHDLTAGIALATQNGEASVVHLPRVLYHRASHASTSPEQAAPSSQRLRAIEWLCQSLAFGATVSRVPDYPALLRAHWPLPEKLPRVSLIVPTRDQYKLLRTCIEGLLNETDYPDLEIIVVDNQSSNPDTLAYFEEIRARGVTVLEHPYPFNYSAINNRAVRYASGELIGLINNDIEIIQRDWLKEMVSQVLRPRVGAVGAKLLWPNRMVQHGGVVIGVNGLAAHTGNNLTEYDAGYLGMNHVTRRQSAVTAACLLLRKSVFEAVAGLNEISFPVAFNDVDLCLKIQKQGLHIIWSAFAKLVHAESASRGKDLTPEKRARAQREKKLFIEHWTLESADDRFYHPSLSLDFLSGPFGGLAIPPKPLISRS
ncbi:MULTISPECIES: glycosyltransferase family 2 protein [Pseudomonas]|uniref:Glycosyl transferase n=1 Tax=Pseudomonas taiwanensis SJ9 TaxID=1388762 RepID=V7D9R7_9PSED|nr:MULTISPECIES: glycosyltransferase family 2 protein [Pseudomonas]ESW38245.1 glycosyl transferase [Pseudomonas taiwanensis SJ9]MBH3377819.1 glycosyltransferase family 2 protein [Pseudomonas asiatica]MBO2891221.1 glycosyltransferase family 2 protein [Pseudomonas asiatica]